MQANEGFTPSRRALDVEDYLDILRRHKSWMAGSAMSGLVISVVAACLWPNSYISEAIIRVQTPLVSERYVPTNANMDVGDRINSMIPSVMKSDSLQNIIERTGIYKKERASQPILDIVTEMQSHIEIGRVISIQTSGGRAPVPAFKVSFEYPDRRMAYLVTRDLVGAFINEDKRTRDARSTKTTVFLTDQTEAAKRELGEIEARLTDFRIKNTGRLPDQFQSNLQALRSLEAQLNAVNDSISRIDQERLLLSSQERIYRDQLEALKSPAEQMTSAAKSERLVQTERDILQLETLLAAYRERYTAAHPDVRAVESQLVSLKKTREGLLKQDSKQDVKKADAQPAVSPLETRVRQQFEMSASGVHAQIEAKDLEKQERLKEQKRLKEVMATYNSRIDASPGLEQEFARLTRDYTQAKARYEELNMKRTQSETAKQLDREESGEMLEILQSPSMPQTPAKPNRYIIIFVGTGFGLLLGLFMVAGREIRDTSLKNLKDARAYTNLAVLGTVPLLQNDLVVRRKRRLIWLAWSVASILAVVAMSASFMYYYTSTRM